MTETENQNVQKPEEMNNQNNNIKNEIRQRNAVLINQQTKRQIRDWLEGNPYQELLEYEVESHGAGEYSYRCRQCI